MLRNNFLLLIAIAFISSCKPAGGKLDTGIDSGRFDPTVTTGTIPDHLEIYSGQNQTGVYGGYLANPVVVVVKDSKGAVVPHVTFSAAVTLGGGSVDQSTVETDSRGQGSVYWKLGTVNTTNVVTITGNGNYTGTPKVITFNATGYAGNIPTVANSSITATSSIVANGVATSSVTITLKDAASNAVIGVTPTFNATDTGSSNSYSTCSVSSAAGISYCTFKSTVAETKTLHLISPIAKDGGTVVFIPGPAAAANSLITGTGPVVADGVSVSTVSITLKDAYNNTISGTVPTFSASNTGSGNSYGICSTSSNLGVSTCTLKSTVAETKTLHLISPVAKDGGTVSFIAGSPSAATTTIIGSSPVTANGVATSSIVITIKDAQGNVISGTIPTFSATDTNATNIYSACSASNASGVSSCTLKSTFAETKLLHLISPLSLNGGSVVFLAGAASSANSTIIGSGPVVANGTSTSSLTITLKDANNNFVVGTVPTFSATNTNSGNNYTACSASNASGVSNCTLSSTVAEIKTLQLLTPISVTGGTVSFTVGPASTLNSNIVGTGPVIANGVATSTITITLKDIGNNSIVGITPTFSATDTAFGNSYNSCSATNASGVATCTMTSNYAEAKTLHLLTPLNMTGGLVNFINSGASIANSTIVGSGPVSANGTSTSTVTITLKDNNSNVIAGLVPTFSATDTGSTNAYGTCSVTNASGVSTCTLTSTTAETKTLQLTSPISKSGGTVVFSAGSASIANSTIVGTSSILADGVATSTVTITLLDAGHNFIVGTVPTFSATNTGTSNSYGTCSATNASGVSTCTLSSTNAEVKTLQLLTPISKSGGSVTFVAGAASAVQSTIIGSGPVPANGSSTSTITITIKDANNNLIAGVTPTFSATDTSSTNAYGACSVTNASGVSTCTLSSTYVETKTLQLLTPVSKTGGNVVFSAGAASIAHSSITGSGPIVANGSSTSVVTITLLDATNNPVIGTTPTFSATNTGLGNAYNSCSATNASGVSTCTMTSTVAETKTLQLLTPISKSGGTVVFTAGAPSIATTTITGTSPVVADGSSTSTITVTLKDANNNLIAGTTPTFSATDTGFGNAYNACSISNASGVSTCTMTSTYSEVKTLHLLTPVNVVGGAVTFTSGVATNTTIVGSGPVVANGTSTSLITITLKDANNNPVVGTTPTFSATDTGSGNTYHSCTVTNASGLATCTMSSTIAEVKTLQTLTPTVTSGGTVTFTASSASSLNTTIVAAGPVIADGSSTSTVTVTLKDVNNNVIVGTTPIFSATNTGLGNSYSACSASNASGVSTCTFTSTVAETKTLQLSSPISLTGGTVVFTPGAATTNSTITGTGSVIANGVATSTVTITLKDANNNLIAGSTPTFSATDTSSGNNYGFCSLSNVSGVSTCTLSSTIAETKTLQLLTPVSKSGGNVVFTAGLATANSTITGSGPVVANGVATSTVTITLKDANNNLIAGTVPTFSATNTGISNLYGICSATNASGVSTCTLASTTAETKTLQLLSPVSKSGGNIIFTAAATSAANSSITGTGPVIANGVSTSTVTITLKDTNNNLIVGIIPTFSATDTSSGNAYTACSATDASGVATCTMTSTKAETKTLQLLTPASKSGGIVSFTAGVPSSTTTTITGTSSVVANGIATSTVTVTIKDVNGNTISGSTPTFSATDSGSNNVYGACLISNASGVSTCTMSSLTAETKTLQLLTPVSVAGGNVDFIAGTASSLNSTIVGTGPITANGSSSSTITITLKDAENNSIVGVTPTFSATDSGSGNSYGICTMTNGAGVSTCSLTSTKAESKILQLTSPTSLSGGSVVFSSGSLDHLSFTTEPSSTVISGASFAIQPSITAYDVNNNILGSGISIALSLTSGAPAFSCTDLTVSTNASGVSTFSGCQLSGIAGTFSLTATSGLKTATSSNIDLSAGAATQLVFSTLPSLSGNTDTALVAQPKISAKDATNNVVTSYLGTITIIGYSDSGCTTPVVGGVSGNGVLAASGVSTFTMFKVLKKNIVAIKATDGSLTTSCLSGMTISPGAVSSLSFSTSPSANAVSGTIFSTQPKVTAYDANLNTLGAGTSILITQPDVSSTLACTAVTALTDASGVAAFDACMLSGTAGTYALTATSLAITANSSDIVLSAGDASILTSDITGTGAITADGSSASTITITLKDINNNAVPGIIPTFAATNTSSTNVYGDCSITDASGVSTCLLTSTFAEIKTLYITSPISLPTANTVAFNPGEASALTSTIIGTGPVLANGIDTSTITINLNDVYSNIISDVVPTFQTNGLGDIVSICSASDALGVSICTLASTYAQDKTLQLLTPVAMDGGLVTFTVGTPISLAFLTAPTTTGDTDTELVDQPIVVAQDATGNNSATYSDAVTIQGFTSNDCSGDPLSSAFEFSGPTLLNGISTFSQFKIIKTSIKSLNVIDTNGLTSSCIDSIDISAGAIASISFLTQPSNVAIKDTPLDVSPTIIGFDSHGNHLDAGVTIDLVTEDPYLVTCDNAPADTDRNGQVAFSNCAITGDDDAIITLTAKSGSITKASKNIEFSSREHCRINEFSLTDPQVQQASSAEMTWLTTSCDTAFISNISSAIDPLSGIVNSDPLDQGASFTIYGNVKRHFFDELQGVGINPVGGITFDPNDSDFYYGVTSNTYGGSAVIYSNSRTDDTQYFEMYSFSTTSQPVGRLVFNDVGDTLYGVTSSLGAAGVTSDEMLYSKSIQSGDFESLLTFPEGSYPTGTPVLTTADENGDQRLFVITLGNGTTDPVVAPMIYAINPVSLDFDTIAFDPGVTPVGSLVYDGHLFYGMTSNGGDNGLGSIYSVDPTSYVMTTIYSMTSADSVTPTGTLALSDDGTLYGATYGSNFYPGSLFSLTLNQDSGFWEYNTIYTFGVHDRNGSYALGNLIYNNGFLYGTANGGTSTNGTVFKLEIGSSKLTTILNLPDRLGEIKNSADEDISESDLVMSDDNYLYTVGQMNLSTGFNGTVYSVDTNHLIAQSTVTEGVTSLIGNKILYSFAPTDGNNPSSGLVQSLSNKNLFYGVTESGGDNNLGTVYSLSRDGSTYTTLYSFTGIGQDGANPQLGTLAIDNQNIYGVTHSGGSKGFGIIFSLGLDGTHYQVLYEFDGKAASGKDIISAPLVVDNKLIGTSYNGGNKGLGMIYQFDLLDNKFDVIGNSTVVDAHPSGNLYFDKTTNFIYGMSLHSIFGFKYTNLPGSYVILNPSMGGFLNGLTMVKNSFIGLSSTQDVLFQMAMNGGAAVPIVNFKNSGFGSKAYGSPVSFMSAGGQNVIYATTSQGGPQAGGVLFSYNLQKMKPTLEYAFKAKVGNGSIDGGNPVGALMLDDLNNLYLPTSNGGQYNLGAIFVLKVK